MRKKLFFVVMLFVCVTHVQASFLPEKDSTGCDVIVFERTSGNNFGETHKRLTVTEKVVAFFIKQKIKRRLQERSQDLAGDEKKANRKATQSFIFALLSFVTPLMLIPAIIFKNQAKSHPQLLSPTSSNRLKVVNAISKFWLIVLLLGMIAVLVLIVIGFGKLFNVFF